MFSSYFDQSRLQHDNTNNNKKTDNLFTITLKLPFVYPLRQPYASKIIILQEYKLSNCIYGRIKTYKNKLMQSRTYIYGTLRQIASNAWR